MKVFKFGANSLVNWPVKKYFIDWNRKVSGPQKKVKDFLFKFWKNSVILEEAMIPGSRFRLDFVNLNKKIVIEVSPRALHVDFNKFLHGGRAGYLKKLQSDAKKQEWAEQNNFVFVELYDEEINNLSQKMFLEKFEVDL